MSQPGMEQEPGTEQGFKLPLHTELLHPLLLPLADLPWITHCWSFQLALCGAFSPTDSCFPLAEAFLSLTFLSQVPEV